MGTPAGSARRGTGVLRWVVRAAAVLVLFVACNTGGVAATTLFPVHAGTLNYDATLRLSLDPGDISTITAPTTFGNIRLKFGGIVPAPGVRAEVQVKERITELLSRPNISVRSLQPGPLELERAARDAATGLALRFALGALLVAAVLLGGYAVWRRQRARPDGRGHALRLVQWGTVLTWTTSCLATFAVVVWTYQPARLATFSTTGILSAVQRNADLLEGVETRAEQTTPYLKNLLALSSALQDKYAPQNLSSPVAARFLLVSDIHGGNQYPLMRTIVQQERVDAVIDSGDLVNFGTATEAEAAGVFKGIASLGVPYLFVKGNHDARSDVDRELLDRLAKVPNVVLLQPDDTTYRVESIGGVRIAGFNDPRWFGDDNKENAAKQKPAAERFIAAMADQPSPDILVSHEPAAVEDVKRAGIRVNGHMHTAALEGNRIQVGTFTGGGPFSHFVAEGGNGEELTGQPSAFDIAAFGDDCRLASLTRYQFRNVVEGRPAYDDVTLINGSRIESAAPPLPGATRSTGTATASKGASPARTCSPELGRTTERITATTPVSPGP
ncbi:metallophosphoesterase [Phycicoccus sp. M110.8]|uniref:metallophosphoesterase family protein n=1 Tax=Phycicoccus sp. M110.8 TaxID=3075433 RepID=UPI0028FD5BE8|nr:metallophosphoesterase [Phycicoccus sp. M110.8]MDU0313568.1 metallophosphoesterase [Phycicoccus sp. M110.8]